MSDGNMQTLVHEMEAVKKLMMLQLLAVGYKQRDLAATLNVSEATLSRMLPKGLSKPGSKKKESPTPVGESE